VKTIQTGSVFYVYEHWRPDKDVCFYVGKGHGKRAQRLRRGKNKHHSNIVAKLARLGMCVEIRMVQSSLTEGEAIAAEIDRIAFWRAIGVPLANLTDGGEGVTGHQHSDATRAVIKAKRKAQKIVHSEETRQKLRISHKGKRLGIKNPAHSERMKGRKHSDEHRAAISAGNMGKFFSEDRRAKISKSHSGRVHSETSRENMSRAHLGKKPTTETKKKMSEAQTRRWALSREVVKNGD
jgi:NUMOD3 motif